MVSKELGKQPKALELRPEEFQDLDYVFDAFNILTLTRGLDQPIRLTEILAYANTYYINDIDEFIQLIQAADEAFLSYGCKTRSNR